MARKALALKRYGGRPPKHATRLLSRVLDQNKLDRRFRVAKTLEAIAASLAAERGGWEAVTASEEILIRRAAFLTLLLSSIESWALGQEDGLVKDGELLGVLRRGYSSHEAQLVRTLTALSIRPDDVGRIPTLREYLEQRASRADGQPGASTGAADRAAANAAADAANGSGAAAGKTDEEP